MKILNIKINYKTKEMVGQTKTPNEELTFNYVNYAVDQKYKEGLNGQVRRMFGRIQRKFEEAIDSGKYKVELEEGEFEFIRDAVRDAKFPPGLARFITTFEDELDKLGKEEGTK